MDFTASTPPMLASDNDSDHDISVFTPPLHGSFDEWYASDDDSDYFAKPYVPLSNLPTPPPAKHSEDTFKNRKAEVELSNSAEAALLGKISNSHGQEFLVIRHSELTSPTRPCHSSLQSDPHLGLVVGAGRSPCSQDAG